MYIQYMMQILVSEQLFTDHSDVVPIIYYILSHIDFLLVGCWLFLDKQCVYTIYSSRNLGPVVQN